MNSAPSIFDPQDHGFSLPEATAPDISTDQAQGVVEGASRLDIFHGYMGVFVVAFLVTLLVTPLMRRLAVANGVIDQPNDPRKVHRIPIAYLGGVAVYLGVLAAVTFSFISATTSLPLMESHALDQKIVPFSILLGMTVIMVTGLIDDVVGISPRIKIAGQLLAAAALAMEDVGVKVAAGLLSPLGRLVGNERLIYSTQVDVPLWLADIAPFLGAGVHLQLDVMYWTGTAIIAIFILGACNASNLIDGLDGLCSGVTAIAAAGLTIIALSLALSQDGPLDSARIVLCLGLLGACLGFLPHNFNPATIFLGDCGSLLLGYLSVAIILTLGDTGRTPLVVAGLIIYMIPIIDTTLAIVRRKLAGLPMSAPDDQHLHHLLKRSLGVKGAVLTIYAMGLAFATLGVFLTLGRARVAYAIALVIASYIGVTAVKMGRRRLIEEQAAATTARRRRKFTDADADADTASAPARGVRSAAPSPEPAGAGRLGD